jgi:methylated-DNA-protein-cysteine methyltransferase-like protein
MRSSIVPTKPTDTAELPRSPALLQKASAILDACSSVIVSSRPSEAKRRNLKSNPLVSDVIASIKCQGRPHEIGDYSDHGSRRMAKVLGRAERLKARVLAVIAAIPEGRVTTYGTIAKHLRINARQVAFVLATLTVEESGQLPWFRVVAAKGVVSSTKLGAVGRRQIARLRAENIAVTARNKVEDFELIAWSPG